MSKCEPFKMPLKFFECTQSADTPLTNTTIVMFLLASVIPTIDPTASPNLIHCEGRGNKRLC